MGILVNIDMPQNCFQCPMARGCAESVTCQVTGRSTNTTTTRLDDCPILYGDAVETQEPTEWIINRLADKVYCPKCGISWNLYIYEQNVKRWAYCPKCGSAKTGVKEV